MLLGNVAVGLALGGMSLFSPLAASAVDTAAGRVIFEAKCVACHELGGNALNPLKPLTLDALQKNGYSELLPVVELLRNGKALL